MHPRAQRCIGERHGRRIRDLIDLVRRQTIEAGIGDDTAANFRKIGVVVGDALADPEPWRRLRDVVSVRHHLRGPHTLDVPGVEDLVRVQAGDERLVEQRRAHDVHVRVLMLQSTRPTTIRRIVDLHHRVVRPGHFAEHRRLGRDHLPQGLENSCPSCPSDTACGIARVPHPPIGDLHAVEIEPADEERHVYEIVVGRRRITPGIRTGRHPRRHEPGRGRMHRDRGREVEPAARRVEKEVAPVEEHEVGAGPRHGVVEGIGLVREGHPYRL